MIYKTTKPGLLLCFFTMFDGHRENVIDGAEGLTLRLRHDLSCGEKESKAQLTGSQSGSCCRKASLSFSLWYSTYEPETKALQDKHLRHFLRLSPTALPHPLPQPHLTNTPITRHSMTLPCSQDTTKCLEHSRLLFSSFHRISTDYNETCLQSTSQQTQDIAMDQKTSVACG